jgi:hypothetical protein
MAGRPPPRPLSVVGHPNATGVQQPKTVLLKRMRIAATVLLLSLCLTVDSLYQGITTAQALSLHLGLVQPPGWLMIIVNVLAGVRILSLLLPARRTVGGGR